MNRVAWAFLAIALSSTAPSKSAEAPASEGAGIPIQSLIRAVAKRTGKKFIIDSRVQGDVQLVGEEAGNVTYNDMLAILEVQGFTAVEGGGFVRVIPETIVRQSALPLVVGAATYPDAQYVAAVIPVRKIPAAGLVPILRPLLPQQAHLAAAICSNAILMIGTYANIKRIESLIAALDTGEPYKVDRCESASAHPRAE